MELADVAKLIKEIQGRKWYKELSPVKWKITEGRTAYYHHKNHCIILPITRIDERTILHELAHHIEYEHAEGFIRYRGVMHGKNFETILARLNLNISLADVISNLRLYPRAPGWQWMPAAKTWNTID